MACAKTSPTNILLVEDEALLRELIMENLQDAGYCVFEASDGRSGLEVLQSDQHIDLLLSDIKLPDIDGYQVAQAGKELRPALKVILMTGYAPSPLPPSLKSTVYQVLQKPFALEALTGRIAGALSA